MSRMKTLSIVLVALVAVCAPAVLPVAAQTQQPPKVQMPQPGVPQIMTMEGKFVRAAYNNEGYVILGYQLVQPVDRRGVDAPRGRHDGARQTPDYTLKRDAISLETPDGKTLPLPSIEEHRKATPSALQNREKVQRDSINYFPPSASTRVRIDVLPRPDLSRDAARRGRAQQHSAPASAGSTSRCRAASSTASTGST